METVRFYYNICISIQKRFHSMIYCKKCVMPDTRPGISFNEEETKASKKATITTMTDAYTMV